MNRVHGDQLGTPVMLTNTDGNAVWEATFAPFGEAVSVNEDPDVDGTAVTMNNRMPGQYYDAETGLNHNWHRYYDPAVGRYVQAEGPNFPESVVQPYKYSNNSPLNNTDRESLRDERGEGGFEGCEEITGEERAQEWLRLGEKNSTCSPSCNGPIRVFMCDRVPGNGQAAAGRLGMTRLCIISLLSKTFLD